MTLRYKKIHQRQKDLQNKIDTKISNEIYNVQRVLEVLIKQNQIQNQGQETDFIQCIEAIEETNKREKQQGQVNSNITNTIVNENKEVVIDYKTKADLYASLLMYNSYWKKANAAITASAINLAPLVFDILKADSDFYCNFFEYMKA